MNYQKPDPSWGKLSSSQSERKFLSGPLDRLDNLRRAIHIFVEFLRGFRALHFVGPCVTVFGSARFAQTHSYYKLTRAVGRALAENGFTVMTGGGPGLMEAANRGAKEINGASVGCNIRLPKEQKPNPYLDTWVEFHYFFVRKVMLLKYSYGFVAMPGGYGTLDEIFETLVLMQTGKIKEFPLVLMGRDFWQPLVTYIQDKLLAEETIDKKDMELFRITDDPAEAAKYIYDTAVRNFGLTWKKQTQRRWWLLER